MTDLVRREFAVNRAFAGITSEVTLETFSTGTKAITDMTDLLRREDVLAVVEAALDHEEHLCDNTSTGRPCYAAEVLRQVRNGVVGIRALPPAGDRT